MSRTSILVFALTVAVGIRALPALDAPPGVVAIPASEHANEFGFGCGGSAVVIAPGQALTLIEALPESRDRVAVMVQGRRIPAVIEREGTRTGAVLLTFDPASSPAPISLADNTRLRLGDPVWSIGNSFGLLEQDGVSALSSGVVSGLYAIPSDSPPLRGRGGRILSTYRGQVIETDAAVNDGNQGGALLDDAGRLVGLVSLGVARGRRLGTAVPIDLVCTDLGLPAPSETPPPPAAGHAALARGAEQVAKSVALVYLERPSGLGNPEASPRPPVIGDTIPPYERERLEKDWDRYYHEQQIFWTDQAVSALVIGPDLLLTSASNLHGDAKRGRVLIDGGAIPCELIAVHTPLDLALLRSSTPLPLPVAELATDPDLFCGDPIGIVGRHHPNDGYTLTAGVVSATDRRAAQSEFAFHQTDAMCNYGNLGGPALDPAGRVVGLTVYLGPYPDRVWFINSGVALFVDSRTIAAVLPTLQAGTSVDQMRTIGLGVRLAPDKDRKELTVKVVIPDTGAAEAGLTPGDILMEIDGHEVHSVPDVSRILVRRKAGDQVRLRIRRGEGELSLDVELRVFGDDE